MPELPEAETIAKALARHLTGKTVHKVEARVPSLRRRLNLQKLRRYIMGKKITRVHRRGKAILIDVSGGATILLQLGMTGGCRICGASEPFEKHEHVTFAISGKQSWRFRDARRFGMVEAFRNNGASSVPQYLKTLGPEPLSEQFNDEYVFRSTRKRKRAIKQLLLDQRHVAGIGNIYASELLFRARIRPRRAAGRLSRKECGAITKAAGAVLREAIAAGGTTLSDYRSIDNTAGKFKRKLRVYARGDSPCLTCSAPIKRIVQDGRATYYCPVCQK